jgi:hypothetical protein
MGKFVFMGLIAILCINMGIYIVEEAGLIPGFSYEPNLTPDAVKDKVDIDKTIKPDPGVLTAFYDIWGGMNKLKVLTSTMVAGVPILMEKFGVPTYIKWSIDAIYFFMFGVFFLEIVTGRDFMD